MRTIVPAVLAIALAAGAALAQASPPKDFARTAAQTDQFEILEAQVVLAQSHDARVKAFAQQMIADHRRTREALKAAVSRSGLPSPPDGIDGEQSKLLYGLQGESGPDLDKLYAAQQVIVHQAALDLQQGYATRGPDANLRQAAASAAPIVQHHLQMAQQLKTAIGR